MSRCVDLDERVTAQFYDQEYEEWTMQTVTIEDVLDSVCDEYTVLPSAQRWIPCSERMPEEKDAGILKKLGTSKRSDYVLATVEVKDERMTVTACTYDGAWDWNMKYAFPDYKVVAWMPPPEPYGGE